MELFNAKDFLVEINSSPIRGFDETGGVNLTCERTKAAGPPDV
jgi:hypothetical protein